MKVYEIDKKYSEDIYILHDKFSSQNYNVSQKQFFDVVDTNIKDVTVFAEHNLIETRFGVKVYRQRIYSFDVNKINYDIINEDGN